MSSEDLLFARAQAEGHELPGEGRVDFFDANELQALEPQHACYSLQRGLARRGEHHGVCAGWQIAWGAFARRMCDVGSLDAARKISADDHIVRKGRFSEMGRRALSELTSRLAICQAIQIPISATVQEADRSDTDHEDENFRAGFSLDGSDGEKVAVLVSGFFIGEVPMTIGGPVRN